MTNDDKEQQIVELEKQLYFDVVKLTSRLCVLKLDPLYTDSTLDSQLDTAKANLEAVPVSDKGDPLIVNPLLLIIHELTQSIHKRDEIIKQVLYTDSLCNNAKAELSLLQAMRADYLAL